MLRKLCMVSVIGFFLLSSSGCFVLLGGAAGGAGTTVWLSGKLTQQVNASFERTTEAAESALKSLKLQITKKTIKENVAQIIAEYSDGKTIWIDIHKTTEASSKIEIRVGAVSSDKEAADKILKRILRYL